MPKNDILGLNLLKMEQKDPRMTFLGQIFIVGTEKNFQLIIDYLKKLLLLFDDCSFPWKFFQSYFYNNNKMEKTQNHRLLFWCRPIDQVLVKDPSNSHKKIGGLNPTQYAGSILSYFSFFIQHFLQNVTTTNFHCL